VGHFLEKLSPSCGLQTGFAKDKLLQAKGLPVGGGGLKVGAASTTTQNKIKHRRGF
jgi:hypothetical protein